MGLSFSAYRKELSSRRFKRAYEALKADCPSISSFADHGDLIKFFHDRAADPVRKDAILFELVTLYRRDERHPAIAPLFVVLFTPAMSNIYAYARRKYPTIDREDLIQDLCLLLLQIIGESDIAPFKVAGRIAMELRNRFRSILNRISGEEFIPIKGDGTDEFETVHAGTGAFADGVTDDAKWTVIEMTAFLDRLIRERRITKQDKRIIVKTLIEGKPLKDVVSPTDYDRLKQRRLKVIELIKKYFAK